MAICYLLFAIRYSLFAIRYSLFAIRYSLFAIRYSLFAIRYSLFAIRYSLFAIRHSPPSRNNVRCDLILDKGDTVAQMELALLEPLDLQDVGSGGRLQRRNRGI